MWSFTLTNWSWLAPSALCLAFGLYAGAQHMEVLVLEERAAAGAAAAEKAVNDAKAADAVRTARLEADHAAEMKSLQEKANAQQVSIAAAPRSDVCVNSGAGRAFLGSLSGSDKAGSGQPRPTTGADASLRRRAVEERSVYRRQRDVHLDQPRDRGGSRMPERAR
jgi:hypothetical protein